MPAATVARRQRVRGIRGNGAHDVREVPSRTMFAATVTGSPLESASRVIRRYEPSGRGFYAGALALFGHDAHGEPWLDSPSWSARWTSRPSASGLLGSEVLVVDAEDDFTAMLAHLLRSAGLRTAVRPYDDPGLRVALAAHRGPVVLGPGDPDDTADPRIATLRELATDLLTAARDGGKPVLGICLGFPMLARSLGLPVLRGERPQQGAQRTVDLFGRRATLGFCNSFSVGRPGPRRRPAAGRRGGRPTPGHGRGDRAAGPRPGGVQFHPESVLSISGAELFLSLMTETVGHGSGLRAAAG
ncbi:anthranilate synthase family protein [Streptomyces sp. NPDC053560]|uniref:anthranilate synthase family protein n=1 Tax=Streptomyces sp. NPDC053560 TaxID=3365711 RepID=UPI0037D27F35